MKAKVKSAADLTSSKPAQAKSQSTLKVTDMGLKSTHPWNFKVYFRTRAYGWRGSKLAIKRLKEAVSEIKKEKDKNLAAEGAIFLMSRFWLSFQDIDTSSGSLGSAVYCAMETLIAIIIKADVSLDVRKYWLDILQAILQEDGVGYVSNIAGYWGDIASYPQLASAQADRLSFIVKHAWQQKQSIVYYDTAYLSALFFAKRFNEVLDVIKLNPYPAWHINNFKARVIALDDIDKAIKYVESLRNIININPASIDLFCEGLLIKANRLTDAYNNYAIDANESNTYVSWFNKIKKKYGSLKTDKEILLNLINKNVAPLGKWFATANKLKLFDLALEIIKDDSVEPKTLNRAALSNVNNNPSYALEVALASLKWMVRGYGYEVSNLDVRNCISTIKQSAELTNTWGDVKVHIREIIKLDKNKVYYDVISSYL